MKQGRGSLGAIVSAVAVLFFSMIVLSNVMPEINKVNTEIAKADTTGSATAALELQESVPDPKGSFKQSAGGFLHKILLGHPYVFLFLILLVAIAVWYFGGTAGQVRSF